VIAPNESVTVLGPAQFDAGKADRATGGGRPLDMARGQIPFWSGFRPPNAN
jgi:hypothetical protein